MTRINCVSVKELCNKHLFAEWREMPRLVENLNISLNRRSKPFSLKEIPPKYLLGRGHVKFFYDKFKFLDKRHKKITKELISRGYKLKLYNENHFRNVEKKYYNDWFPSLEDIKLNRKRIKEKMPKNPRWSIKDEQK